MTNNGFTVDVSLLSTRFTRIRRAAICEHNSGRISKFNFEIDKNGKAKIGASAQSRFSSSLFSLDTFSLPSETSKF